MKLLFIINVKQVNTVFHMLQCFSFYSENRIMSLRHRVLTGEHIT